MPEAKPLTIGDRVTMTGENVISLFLSIRSVAPLPMSSKG